MERSITMKLRHRLVSYALVAALSCGGATIVPFASEASSPHERRDVAGMPDAPSEGHRGLMAHWFGVTHEEAGAAPSGIQSWLAGIYLRLIGLKATIISALPHAWKWDHGKPGKSCH
jgi:hypothetical protein